MKTNTQTSTPVVAEQMQEGELSKYSKLYSKLPANPKDFIITLTSKGETNPKKGAARERFANYKNGMTVAQALEKGIWRIDLRWDVAHGLITLAEPTK